MTDDAQAAGTTQPGKGTCGDCPFFDLIQGRHPQTNKNVPETWGGICRANPPANVYQDEGLPGPGAGISMPRPGMFPLVGVGDWCGTHPLRVAYYHDAVAELRRQIQVDKAKSRGHLLSEHGQQ